jgi:hypothetical protein
MLPLIFSNILTTNFKYLKIMKYTITRALAELKVLKNRYNSEINTMKLIAVKHGNKLRSPYSSYKEEDFRKQALATYQSVVALEKRIVSIKAAIDASNFQTKIQVGGKEMTVLEALNMKSFIDLKKTRLSYYKSLMQRARNEYEQALSDNKNRIEKIVTEQTASSSVKDPDIEKKTIESIESLYKVDFIDPLELEEKIKELETEIQDFENNVDYALSESNSTTYIEVED